MERIVRINGKVRLFIVGLLSMSIQLSALASNDETSSGCDLAMTKIQLLNANEFWHGANECAKSGNRFHTTFLLLAGQIRAMTDLGTLKAASDEDEIKVGELYGILYYKAGGSGHDEIYRDISLSNNLLHQLNNWDAELHDSYDPGWKYQSNIGTLKYAQMFACQKAVRISKLNWYASLIRNDEYYEASKELNALRAKNPGAITSGSDIEKQISSIMTRMRAIKPSNPLPRTQPKECMFANKYEPDPDAEFTQLYKGANGPKSSKALAFKSKDEVIDSWISESLSPDLLNNILEQVNFENQILVSLSFGKRRNSTGTIYISDVNYNAVRESLDVSGLIGVTESKCEEPFADSYPFALAVAPRPEIIPAYPGMFLQNFPDGCKPVIDSSIVTVQDE